MKKLWTVCVAFGAVALLAAGTGALQAQSPKLGPDEARFQMTMSNKSSSSVMGMTMDVAMGMVMITRVTITSAGGDTLRVRTVIDSVSMTLDSPMLAGAGLNPADMLPVKKGDTSVVLMSTGGSILQHVAGAELLSAVGGGTAIPAGVSPGTSWDVNPPNMGAAAGADPMAAAMVDGMMNALKGTSKMTYEGIVDREGSRAWKFAIATAATNVTLPIPDTPMSVTIKQMTGSGQFFIDLAGRVLHQEYTQTSETGMAMEGTTITANTSMTLRTERLGGR